MSLRQSDTIPAKPFKVKYQTKKIKKVSTKQQLLKKAYSAQRGVYLKTHPYCEATISFPGNHICDGLATDIHHKAGRGSNLLDESTWLPVCRNCHRFIELNSAWAKAKGYSLNRLTI